MTEVIVMTAYGTIESAVEAMRLGAFDYIQKPFTEQELLVKVAKALDNRRLAGEVTFLASEFKDRYKFENIIGRSRAVREVLGRIVRIAPTDAIVLITGESGTGKELVAKAIHANSKRAERPFVPVNCAAITETLLESELFGHARGSFTGAVSARKGLFEEADGGTFFFDEIAETPHHLPGQAPPRDPGERDPARRREQGRSAWTCASSPRRTRTCSTRSPRSASGRTSTTGSTSRASSCRRCASAARTSPIWSSYFLEKFARKMGVRAQAPRQRDRLAHALRLPRATSASSST